MTDLRPALSAPASGAPANPPGVRDLTAEELGHLERARAHLRASGADLTDPQSVGTLLHTTRTRWAAEPDAPVPQALVMALGVGVGDLVVARVPGARWALRTAGSSPSPAVVSLSGEDAALPLADVATRWRTGCAPTWVAEYVVAAAAHLATPAGHEVPTPRLPARSTQDLSAAEPAPLPARAPALVPTHPTTAVAEQTAAASARADAPLPVGADAALPARADALVPARGDALLPTTADAAVPAGADARLPTRGAAPASVPDVVGPALAAALPARAAAASSGPAGYFANAAGAFPTRHVVAPAPGPLSAGPSRPVHPPLASAFPTPDVAAPARTTPAAPQPSAPSAYRVPADLPHPPSRAAQDIALGVLEQALELAVRHGGAARPFAVVDGSPTQNHQPHPFDGEPARALQEARSWVRTTGAVRAAVAWFGRLSGEGGDAVFVEASDAGAPSLVVAHRYSAVSYDEGRTRPARPVGDPLILGQGVPLL